jgi:NO-binding membrane sensor protein with MHYT domain/GAF domain-containing protein
MIGTYHPVLVALSIIVGVLAFHVGLDFAERGTVARGRPRLGWIAGGAAVTGLGVWSLHILGILALRLRDRGTVTLVTFDIPHLLLAAGVAVVAMAPALAIVVRRRGDLEAVFAAGGLLGTAIVASHYVAMTALRVPARAAHDSALVVASIAVALIAATVALWLGAELRGDGIRPAGRRLGTAVALGAAAAATHYTAMAAMRLTPSGEHFAIDAPALPATPGVGVVIAAAIMTLLGLATLAAAIDRRVRDRLDRGEEHARLYHEAAAARSAADSARAQAEETSRILLEAARVLGASLDLDRALRHVTGLFVPRLADYCLVYLRGADGSYTQAAAAHADEEKTRLLEELGTRYRPDPSNPESVVGRVIRTRQALVSTTVSEAEAARLTGDSEVVRIFRRLEPTSYVSMPLIARGELVGAISLVTSARSDRRFSAADLTLVELLGARAALALDNARLYTEARQAHDQAVRASQLESQLMQARLEALRAQLNPHFLFNALNTVAMLVRRKANDDALRAVVSLSEVLRRALAGQGSQEVTLREELTLVEHYLQVEQLRFRDRLSVDVDVDAELLDARVPGLVLQPLVENAVRHGVARRAGHGRVEIAARQVAGRLLLQVSDNGPGFPDGWEAAASGRVGLANTRERLARLYGAATGFEAHNAPEGGAVVSIEIPLRMSRDGSVVG